METGLRSKPVLLRCSNTGLRLAIGVLASVLAGAGAPVCTHAQPATAAGQELELHIDDSAARDPQTVRALEEGTVVLRITADWPLEIHVHGLDVRAHVVPGEVTTLSVDARAAGRFPVTMHRAGGRHATVLYIEVHPQ